MQIKKYAACLAFGVMAMFTAQAQDILPEEMPNRPVAERIVAEVAPIATAEATEVSVNHSAINYNAAFGENVVQTALQYLGARYSLGSKGPNVFDCSGFTSYVYGKANVARISDLKKGDLVFFGGRGNSRRVGHVGIVTEVDPSGENFSFVHASLRGVKVSNSSEHYYNRRYMGARRIIEN